jgi:hypothetical protein
MQLVEKDVASDLANRIVRDFGDGNYRKDRYIFDQITKLPKNYTSNRVPVSKLLASLGETALFVILDPHPNNSSSVKDVSMHFGLDNEWAYKVTVDEVREIFLNEDCDFYLLNKDGELIAVGCHEDFIEQGERIVWAPSPIADT